MKMTEEVKHGQQSMTKELKGKEVELESDESIEMGGGPLYQEDKFWRLTLEGKWEEVIKMCEEDITLCTIKFNEKRGTALHLAVNEGDEYAVNRLVRTMINHKRGKKALELKNERGDTPLHLAASRGLKSICECIIGKNEERKDLIRIRNEEGETPLFQAALSPEKETFMYLISLMPDQSLGILIRKNGDSILHCAIRREYFDYALIIMENYPDLGDICNGEGFSPLKVLATRPSAFKSGSNLKWYNRILYHCVDAETLDLKEEKSYNCKKKDEQQKNKKLRENEEKNKKFPDIYDTCYLFFVVHLLTWFKIILPSGKRMEEEDPEKRLKDPSSKVPANYATCHQFMKFACIYILGLSGAGVEKITKMKQKHIWSGQLLSKFMEKHYESYIGSGGPPSYDESGKKDFISYQKEKFDSEETAILVAARNGIVEMVNEIISKTPTAIHETNSKKKNVLHVAVENRQTFVVEELKNWSEQKKKNELVFKNLRLGVDEEECTLLHLAARQSDKGWTIHGAALQMMWHIKWFQYIKDLVPEHFTVRTNKDEKTASEIFLESHTIIVKDANDWLKDTSESCSVVAALLAGVSFATSTTVPGSFDTDTGEPPLETKNAFESFAMCSLIGLCFSVTALILFLSILTSRKDVKDFRRSLPLKVLSGLGSLFISTAALFATFCSAHIFIVDEKYKQTLIVIYAVTCLPVGLYAIAQFPLFFDILRAIATKVPLRTSDKENDI